MGAIHFLDMPVEQAKRRLLGQKVLLRVFHQKHDAKQGKRDDEQREQHHLPRNRKHHPQIPDDAHDVGNHRRQRLVERLHHRVDVVGEARNDVAARMSVEIRKRQPVDFLAHLTTQPIPDLVRHRRHNEALRVFHARAKRVNGQQDGARLLDRVKVDAANALHLVHESIGDFGNDITRDLRADDGDRHRGHGADDANQKAPFVRRHIRKQLPHRLFHVFWFLMHSFFMRHTLIPPSTAGKARFPDTPGTSSSAAHACLCPRLSPRRAR